MAIASLAERTADYVRRHAPSVFCHDCLSRRIRVFEKDIRDAAQYLVVVAEWQLRSRACNGCGRLGSWLERPKDDSERYPPITGPE